MRLQLIEIMFRNRMKPLTALKKVAKKFFAVGETHSPRKKAEITFRRTDARFVMMGVVMLKRLQRNATTRRACSDNDGIKNTLEAKFAGSLLMPQTCEMRPGSS